MFKQIKQNFPLKYFYGKNTNAIKIQIWVTPEAHDTLKRIIYDLLDMLIMRED